MNIEAHIRLFDGIASIYGLFFGYQVRMYRRILAANPVCFGGVNCRVLDIGCGTGALAAALSENGLDVTGLDGSIRMIDVARRLNRHTKARFIVGNALEPIEGRYDVVVASYVLHGLPQRERFVLYETMKRLATHRVIIMDYNQRRGVLTSLIERLEGGDYFNFIRTAESEMRQIFPSVQILQTGKRAAWYICECDQSLKTAKER